MGPAVHTPGGKEPCLILPRSLQLGPFQVKLLQGVSQPDAGTREQLCQCCVSGDPELGRGGLRTPSCTPNSEIL